MFGSTVAELGIAARVEAGEAKVFEKRLFSMLTEEVVAHLLEPPAAADAAMATEGRDFVNSLLLSPRAAAAAVPPMEASAAGRYANAVLFGIETHVRVVARAEGQLFWPRSLGLGSSRARDRAGDLRGDDPWPMRPRRRLAR